MEKRSIPPGEPYSLNLFKVITKERLHLINMICQIMEKKFQLLSQRPKQKSVDVSKN